MSRKCTKSFVLDKNGALRGFAALRNSTAATPARYAIADVSQAIYRRRDTDRGQIIPVQSCESSRLRFDRLSVIDYRATSLLVVFGHESCCL